jgi:transposase InsO family protein
MVLFFIELSTRRVEIGGISAATNGLWMNQIARNLTDSVDGLLTGKRYLIHDRDPLFTDEFLRTLKDVGVESVKLPPRSPNLNAHAERFVRSIKESCLERLVLFGQSSLRTAVQNFVAHTRPSATIKVWAPGCFSPTLLMSAPPASSSAASDWAAC